MKKAQRARDVLREIPCRELVQMMKKAADFYRDATLPMGDGEQSPTDFAAPAIPLPPVCRSTCAKATWAKTISCSQTMDRILRLPHARP
jgi:hypothetical protein